MHALTHEAPAETPQRAGGRSAQNAFTLIVPTLDEAENIGALLQAVHRHCAQAGLTVETLVADGGSSDATCGAVNECGLTGDRLLQPDSGGGLAGDILAAVAAATYDVVAVMDADFSHPPQALPELVRPVLNDDADLAIGSRYVPGGRIEGWPWHRRALSRVGTLAAWPLASSHDPLSGFFATRRGPLLEHAQQATGFKLALELIASGDDALRIHEVPITFRDRERGNSKLGARETRAYFTQVFALAGGTLSSGTTLRFGAVGLLGVLVDWLCYQGLQQASVERHLAYVGAFVVATVFNYALNSRWSFHRRPRAGLAEDLTVYVRYLLICVLALALRMALYSAGLDNWGWPAAVAAAAGIALGAGVNLFGTALFVFPQSHSRSTPRIRWRIFALCVIAYAFALQFLLASGVDLIPEEAYYWNYAQHLAMGYLDHPPMVAWLIAAGTALLGNVEIGVRLGALICGVLTTLLVFGWTRRAVGRDAALVAALLCAVLPGWFAIGWLATPDAALLAAWAGALWALYAALVEGRPRAWYIAGLCVGLGMLAKYSIALLPVAALIYVVANRDSRFWLRRPQPWLAALIAIACFSPVIWWNAQHDWASFLFQGPRRWRDGWQLGLDDLLGSDLLLLTPVGLLGAIAALGQHHPMRRLRRFAVFFTLLPLCVFVAYSLQGTPKLNWTAPVWLACLPLLGERILVWTLPGRGRAPRWRIHGWQPAAVGSLLLWILLAGPVLIGFNIGSNDMDLPVAWEEMAAHIMATEKRVEARTGRRVLIVGMNKYWTSSQFAFYDPDGDALEETAGRHLVGRSSLMWRQWFPARKALHMNLLLVAFDGDNIERRDLARYFQRIGPRRWQPIMKNGRQVGGYYYRMGYNYNGLKPATDAAVDNNAPPMG